MLGGKNVLISDFGRKSTLNFGEDIRIFEVLCLKFLLSPPPKFSRSATGNNHRIFQYHSQGGYSPSIGLWTKMQNKENNTFLVPETFFALEWTKK